MENNRLSRHLLTTDAKRGQAMIETILMLPFIVVVIIFIYQAYILIHKTQIAQKYLKGVAIGRTLNRYETTVAMAVEEVTGPPTDGKFFFIYEEIDRKMKYNLDGATRDLLLSFLTDQGRKTELKGRLDEKKGKQALGFCLGGGGLMGEQVDPEIFNKMQDDMATCTNK